MSCWTIEVLVETWAANEFLNDCATSEGGPLIAPKLALATPTSAKSEVKGMSMLPSLTHILDDLKKRQHLILVT